MSVIDNLREAIESQHAEAVKALSVLERYLSNSTSPPVSPEKQRNGHAEASDADGRTSIRETVLAIIRTRWATASEICDETNLEIRQVRGVLNAPALVELIERQRPSDGGEVRYRWRSDDQETP